MRLRIEVLQERKAFQDFEKLFTFFVKNCWAVLLSVFYFLKKLLENLNFITKLSNFAPHYASPTFGIAHESYGVLR
jgi:hypothetical protein